MFGSAKIQNLEIKIQSLNDQLQKAAQENQSLKQALESAQRKSAELEAKLADTDLEQLKEEARASKAEFEGLKGLYTEKIQAFDASKEDEEQAFAREAALKRHNLENEIRDNRQSNQEYVSSTVKSFSDSYNYYLNQIKLLMDALSDVAASAGEVLFTEPNDDLKAKIGQQMAEKLKAETDPLRTGSGDRILIGSLEEEPAEEACEACEEAAEAVEEVCEACEEAVEAAQEACEACEEAAAEAPAEE